MAATTPTRSVAFLDAEKEVLTSVRRLLLVSSSQQAQKANQGMAEVVRRICALDRVRWLRLRDGRLLPITPTGIDSYSNGRRILHFAVICVQAGGR
jgi:hypothetical protein